MNTFGISAIVSLHSKKKMRKMNFILEQIILLVYYFTLHERYL
jgi:hypothetical protein